MIQYGLPLKSGTLSMLIISSEDDVLLPDELFLFPNIHPVRVIINSVRKNADILFILSPPKIISFILVKTGIVILISQNVS